MKSIFFEEMAMKVETRKNDREMRIKLQDRMSFSDHGLFREVLANISKVSPSACIFDMSELASIDSAGLGMLMIAHEQAKKAGWALSIEAPQGHVRQLLQLACFDKILTIKQ
jgi:HptB-dependent secretion and biofilm anti anti-sigma factor